MKKAMAAIANRVLKTVGLRLSTLSEEKESRDRYAALVNEAAGLFSEVVFPGLPSCAGRTDLLSDLVGTQVSEAMYLVEYLHRSVGLDGDVCEFGVAQGATSAPLANEIRAAHKSLWLFDSFQGLPKPSSEDILVDDIFDLGSMEKYEGTMCCQASQVASRLKAIGFPLDRVKVVPGFIEETIQRSAMPQDVCFAYVDFDFYRPTVTVLEFLDKALAPGGHAVVDDYGFFSAGVKTAVDEFLKSHADRYDMTLPFRFASHFCVLSRRH